MTITKALLSETLASLKETFDRIDKLEEDINDELNRDFNYRSTEQSSWALAWMQEKEEEIADEIEAATEGLGHISHFLEELGIITKDEWKQIDAVFTNVINRLEAKK